MGKAKIKGATTVGGNVCGGSVRTAAVRRLKRRVARLRRANRGWWATPIELLPTEEDGKYNTFADVHQAFVEALKTFKENGSDFRFLNPLAAEVRERTCFWIRRVHPEYMQYFFYQYCEGCRDATMKVGVPGMTKKELRDFWNRGLQPRVYPPWECPLGTPMPAWPASRKRSRSSRER